MLVSWQCPKCLNNNVIPADWLCACGEPYPSAPSMSERKARAVGVLVDMVYAADGYFVGGDEFLDAEDGLDAIADLLGAK